MRLFNLFKSKSPKERIIKKFYSDYQEKPFIGDDRDIQKWENLISTSPNLLVPKENMIRNVDGLLPGHVYQIYWIDKYKPNRRIPVYFEYEFGIDFKKEKKFLEDNGYIKDFSATEKGREIIESYHYIITKKAKQNIPERMDLNKELNKFDEDQELLREFDIKPYETRDEKIGFVYQTNAIADYKEKKFDDAEKGFLKALEYDFYSPGGVDYLAKIYRKRKDYEAEIELLERSIKKLSKTEEFKNATDGLEYRLERSKILKSKNHSK